MSLTYKDVINMPFDLLLKDRLRYIRDINFIHHLDKNAVIFFSGGLDSMVMHTMIDMALPGNSIPRVYINTGIEYQLMIEFVTKLAEKDNRIEIIKPTRNIKQMLEDVGYPFKSKEHSLYLSVYQHSGNTKTINRYLNRTDAYACKDILRYQFTPDFKIKVSKKCCDELKKKPCEKYMKEHGKTVSIVGLRQEEGGLRKNITSCTIFDDWNNLNKFFPLRIVSHKFEKWFVSEYKVPLCDLYKEPYNFTRTGCKGCPYNLYLQEDLNTLENFFPKERKQCELIWKPVYDEYRRIGYRLSNQLELTF